MHPAIRTFFTRSNSYFGELDGAAPEVAGRRGVADGGVVAEGFAGGGVGVTESFLSYIAMIAAVMFVALSA
jgi:hypothetical protein